MTYGLRCWNSKAQVIFEATDRLTRVIGTITPPNTAQGGSGTINVNEPGNIFAYICLNQVAADDSKIADYDFNRLLAIDQSTKTIRYENINSPIVYGVY